MKILLCSKKLVESNLQNKKKCQYFLNLSSAYNLYSWGIYITVD